MSQTSPPERPTLKQALAPVISIVLVVAVILGIMRWSGGSAGSAHSHGHVRIGQVLNDLELVGFDGSRSKLAEKKNALTVINLWATWCAPCVAEMPSLSKMQERFAKEGLALYAVSVDENPADTVPKFLRKVKFKQPIYIDEEQRLSERFGVEALPYTVILDRQLKVVYAEPGDRDWDSQEVQEFLRKHM